jgi:hypothetical protein
MRLISDSHLRPTSLLERHTRKEKGEFFFLVCLLGAAVVEYVGWLSVISHQRSVSSDQH